MNTFVLGIRKDRLNAEHQMALRFLTPLSPTYPGIALWFNTRVIPGLGTGCRYLVTVERNSEIIALGIAKKVDQERKLCTVRVHPAYEGKGIGIRVLDKLLEWLDVDTPLATVSEEKMDAFDRIFDRYGFKLTSIVNGLYRPGKLEYIFNENTRLGRSKFRLSD